MATKIQLTDECRDVLARSTISADRVVLPEGQLDRKLYIDVNKALTAAGGKWVKAAKAHVFDRDPREALGLAVSTGKTVNEKQVKQAFYTPHALALRVAEAADLSSVPGCTLLEPSCGRGSLIMAAMEFQLDMLVWAFDSDREAVDVLGRRGLPVEAKCCDFLTVEPERGRLVHRVIMNPPFAKQQDIDHVTHALRFVRPGGRLVAIMWPSWQSSQTRKAKAFRELLAKHRFEVEPIDAGEFKESGTNVATVLLVVDVGRS